MSVCNEKKHGGQKKNSLQAQVWNHENACQNLGDLNLYPTVDQIYMKAIYANYNVRMGYYASKTNVQEDKVYAIVIRTPNCLKLL